MGEKNIQKGSGGKVAASVARGNRKKSLRKTGNPFSQKETQKTPKSQAR